MAGSWRAVPSTACWMRAPKPPRRLAVASNREFEEPVIGLLSRTHDGARAGTGASGGAVDAPVANGPASDEVEAVAPAGALPALEASPARLAEARQKRVPTMWLARDGLELGGGAERHADRTRLGVLLHVRDDVERVVAVAAMNLCAVHLDREQNRLLHVDATAQQLQHDACISLVVRHPRHPHPLVRVRLGVVAHVRSRVLDVLKCAREAFHRALRKVQHAGGRLKGQADQALAGTLDQPADALGLGTLDRLRDQASHALHHAPAEALSAEAQAFHRMARAMVARVLSAACPVLDVLAIHRHGRDAARE
eukprot:scaffold9726_cov119-Isochrysis_galbana.AAC.25